MSGYCGESCYPRALPFLHDVEFALDGAATHIARGPSDPEVTPTPALTSMRLGVNFGEMISPDTTRNLFGYADFSGPFAPPRLVVRWCEPTATPTPTPEL